MLTIILISMYSTLKEVSKDESVDVKLVISLTAILDAITFAVGIYLGSK